MKFHASLENYRVLVGEWATQYGDDYGAFFIPGPCGVDLKVIASAGDPASGVDWEHVSVSVKHRTPNWAEMCAIKDLFFDPEEVVMQLHPAKSQYVNVHPYVLHLWRPKTATIPLPPLHAV